MALFSLALAVDTSVYPVFSVGEPEHMRKLLLGGGDASRIFTLYHVYDLIRRVDMAPFGQLAVFDDVDGDTRIYITDSIQVHIDESVDFDYILPAHLLTFGVLDKSYLAIQRIQSQDTVETHPLSGLYMVKYDAVLYLSYYHLLFHLQKLKDESHPYKFAIENLFEILSPRIVVHSHRYFIDTR